MKESQLAEEVDVSCPNIDEVVDTLEQEVTDDNNDPMMTRSKARQAEHYSRKTTKDVTSKPKRKNRKKQTDSVRDD